MPGYDGLSASLSGLAVDASVPAISGHGDLSTSLPQALRHLLELQVFMFDIIHLQDHVYSKATTAPLLRGSVGYPSI